MQKTSDDLLQEVVNMLQKEESQKRPINSTISSREKRTKEMATEYLSTPQQLVGKDIVHTFLNEASQKKEFWDGKINSSTNEHTIMYTGDSKQYEYDLTIVITNSA